MPDTIANGLPGKHQNAEQHNRGNTHHIHGHNIRFVPRQIRQRCMFDGIGGMLAKQREKQEQQYAAIEGTENNLARTLSFRIAIRLGGKQGLFA